MATIASLAPRATAQCQAFYTVTQGDIDTGGGQLVNIATVTDPDGVTAEFLQVVDTVDPAAGLELTKVAEPDNVTAPGDVVYTLTARNSGNVTLTGVTVVDDLLDELSCVPAQPASLAPGASMECSATLAVDQDLSLIHI